MEKLRIETVPQNERSFRCLNCNVLVANQSGIMTMYQYDNKLSFYALTCPLCGFIETFKDHKSIHGNKEFNDIIKNLNGTNLKIFDEIKFNANNHK